MDLFFNELSITAGPVREIGKQWMTGLIILYKKAAAMGFKELKTTETFLSSPLAPGYNLHDWLNDQTVDRDTRYLVKTKVSKHPFIEQLLEQKDNEGNRLWEFKYKNRNAVGLGAAHLYDSFAVSFANSEEWDTHLLELHVSEYSKEEDGIIQSSGNVRHGSKPEHLDYLTPWLDERKRKSIANGKLLWLNRQQYFPHLLFCTNIENRLSSLSGSEPEFHAIVKHLFAFEDYCSTWETGVFTGERFPFKATLESTSRLASFRKKLTILCPDGEDRVFSWHLRYTPGAGRIHFFPDNSKKIIYIGYIGPKIQ
jgi:hypothetical protein